MFWQRKKEVVQALPPGMGYRNPFDAVPLLAPGVTVHDNGAAMTDGFVLRRELDIGTTRRARLLRWLKLGRVAHLKLDHRGSFFWSQIDGQRSLEVIAENLGQEFKLSMDDARGSALLFTKNLMLRHFLLLKIDKPETART